MIPVIYEPLLVHDREKWAVFGSHWLKVEKTIAYTFAFVNWSITKEGSEKLFELILISKVILLCVILGCFVNLMDDLYYESLPWFMIYIAMWSTYLLLCTNNIGWMMMWAGKWFHWFTASGKTMFINIDRSYGIQTLKHLHISKAWVTSIGQVSSHLYGLGIILGIPQ